LGPAHDSGLARSDHCGSVRKLTPSSWTRRVAWPTHVTVAAPALSRRARPSFTTMGNDAFRGELRRRGITNRQRVQNPGRA
jgi:hypothetical protein